MQSYYIGVKVAVNRLASKRKSHEIISISFADNVKARNECKKIFFFCLYTQLKNIFFAIVESARKLVLAQSYKFRTKTAKSAITLKQIIPIKNNLLLLLEVNIKSNTIDEHE